MRQCLRRYVQTQLRIVYTDFFTFLYLEPPSLNLPEGVSIRRTDPDLSYPTPTKLAE